MKTTSIISKVIMAMLIASLIAPLVLAEDTQTDVMVETETADEDGSEPLILTGEDTPEEGILIDDIELIEVTELPEPGIGPNSKFYGLENNWDKWRIAWTFNKEKKIQKAIAIAEERLAEAKIASEQGDDKAAEIAQKRYEQFIEKAEKSLEEIEENGDKTKAEIALERIVRAQERIEAHKEKVSIVHARILEKYSEKMSEEKIAHLEEVFGRISARAEKAQEVVMQREENIRTRLKVLGEMTEEELDEIESNIRTKVQEENAVKLAKKQDRKDNPDSIDSTNTEEPGYEGGLAVNGDSVEPNAGSDVVDRGIGTIDNPSNPAESTIETETIEAS